MAGPREDNASNTAFRNQMFASIVTGLGSSNLMYAMSFPTFGIPSMQRDPDFDITSSQLMWMGAIVPLVWMFANYAAGMLVERLGRKPTVLLGGTLFIVSYLGIALATSATMALVSRGVSAVGGSFVMTACMMYTTEVLHTSTRERLGGIGGLMAHGGTLVAFAAGTVLDWRGTAWIGLLLIVPMMTMFSHLSESPVYLLRQGKRREALAALEWYRPSATEAEKELDKLMESMRNTDKIPTNFKEMFTPPYLKPLLVTLGFVLTQQVTGITGINVHAVKIFKYLGTPIDPAYCTIMIAVVNILTTLLCSEIHTRFDRKSTLLVTTMTLVNLLVFLGIFCWAKESGGQLKAWTDVNGIVGLILVLLIFVAFGTGLGPMPFMFLGEALPSKIKGRAFSMVITIHILISIIVVQGFNYLVDSVGYSQSFVLFAALTTFSASIVYYFMIETKGKSISEIDNYYNSLIAKKTN